MQRSRREFVEHASCANEKGQGHTALPFHLSRVLLSSLRTASVFPNPGVVAPFLGRSIPYSSGVLGMGVHALPFLLLSTAVLTKAIPIQPSSTLAYFDPSQENVLLSL